jgi:hypothetical protein
MRARRLTRNSQGKVAVFALFAAAAVVWSAAWLWAIAALASSCFSRAAIVRRGRLRASAIAFAVSRSTQWQM